MVVGVLLLMGIGSLAALSLREGLQGVHARTHFLVEAYASLAYHVIGGAEYVNLPARYQRATAWK